MAQHNAVTAMDPMGGNGRHILAILKSNQTQVGSSLVGTQGLGIILGSWAIFSGSQFYPLTYYFFMKGSRCLQLSGFPSLLSAYINLEVQRPLLYSVSPFSLSSVPAHTICLNLVSILQILGAMLVNKRHTTKCLQRRPFCNLGFCWDNWRKNVVSNKPCCLYSSLRYHLGSFQQSNDFSQTLGFI